jgi:hypothetical protein
MPFTLSHPAIILPLYRLRYLDFTALAVGSMAPDLEYFFRPQALSVWGHSPVGLLFFNLPLTIVVALLFHQIIKPALIPQLPAPYDHYYSAARYQSWITTPASYWKIPLSAIIGAASHVLWDSFTHRSGFFVNQLPLLKSSFPIANLNLPIYTLLQYGFSLIGLLTIAGAIWLALPTPISTTSATNHNPADELTASENINPVPPKPPFSKRVYWTIIALIMAVNAGLRSWIVAPTTELQWINEFLVGSLSGLLAGLLIMSRWYLRQTKH